MKTEKYAIQFVSNEVTLSTEIAISKKEYEKQFSFLEKQSKATAGSEYEIDHRVINQENEQIIITRQRFSVGMGDVWLTSYICKTGYCFKKKPRPDPYRQRTTKGGKYYV